MFDWVEAKQIPNSDAGYCVLKIKGWNKPQIGYYKDYGGGGRWMVCDYFGFDGLGFAPMPESYEITHYIELGDLL